MKKIKISGIVLAFTLLTIACNNEGKIEKLDDGSVIHCFAKTTKNPTNPENISKQELILQVMADSTARGDLNWKPYEKDARLGIVEGEFTQSGLIGTYKYAQEGSVIEENVRITIDEEMAIIYPVGNRIIVNGQQIQRDYAVNDTLLRINCK